MNVESMTEKDMYNILREALYEFPVAEIKVSMPEWIAILDANHPLKKKYIGKTGIVTQSNSIVIDSLLHLMTLQITLGSSKNQGGHHNDIR